MLLRFDRPTDETGVGGEIVSSRRVIFGSQAEQVLFLRKCVEEYRSNYAIRSRARDIVFRQRCCPPRDKICQAIALGSWVQENIVYVEELPEVFQTPTTTIAEGYGDCDDHVTLVCALCESIGIETQIMAMEWDDPDGERSYHHIFGNALVARAGTAYRLPLDTTLRTPVSDLADPVALSVARGDKLQIFTA